MNGVPRIFGIMGIYKQWTYK